MIAGLRHALGRRIPAPLKRSVLDAYSRLRTARLRAAFDSFPTEPAWLGQEQLEAMAGRYRPPAPYGYDAEAVDRRGRERAAIVLDRLGASRATNFLELGCWDGMVAGHLARMGKSAAGIDFRADGFDPRAVAWGARLAAMDAKRLEFADESFDCVFSFDAFEHFDRPDLVLDEAIRVVRPGGFVYLDFGPLYMAPFGLHAYRTVPVPYCQFLFEPETMARWATEKGLAPIDFDQCNGWPAGRFRELWASRAGRLERTLYRETSDAFHLDLVWTYPSCFRGKAGAVDDLVVTQIEALFRRIR